MGRIKRRTVRSFVRIIGFFFFFLIISMINISTPVVVDNEVVVFEALVYDLGICFFVHLVVYIFIIVFNLRTINVR